MHKVLKFMVIALGLLLASSNVNAANVVDQINEAIKNGDFKRVQTLVNSNPSTADQAERSLLKLVQDVVSDDPERASLAMTAASTLSPHITPSGAGGVVDDVKFLIKLIADKALLICNPSASDDSGQVKTPADPKKAAAAEAMASVMNGAETIAQVPAILAIDPQLVAQIQAQSAQCQEGETALLAQRPRFSPPRITPHIQPPPINPPPREEGSPD